jgi:hypothetical protein
VPIAILPDINLAIGYARVSLAEGDLEHEALE